MRAFLAAAALLGLGACETGVMSERECLAGDWYGAGYADGAAGLLADAYEARAAQCAGFGAMADRAAYQQGREEALTSLCTEEGGYAYGRAGNDYRGVCGGRREDQFLAGYLSGRRLFSYEVRRQDAQAAYDEAAREVDYHRRQIDHAQRLISDEAASPEDVDAARDDLRYSSQTLPRHERKMEDALYELGRADEAMDQAINGAASWRNSAAFVSAHQSMARAHEFARREAAIDHCTDIMIDQTPVCMLRPGAALKDMHSGAVCAMGPGEARYLRNTIGLPPARRDIDALTASGESVFAFFPGETGSSRATRRPSGIFRIVFDSRGAYQGLVCADA